MQFRIAGIPSDLAAEVRQTLRSPQYGHPAHRETATGYGPCRLCLRTFEVGVMSGSSLPISHFGIPPAFRLQARSRLRP